MEVKERRVVHLKGQLMVVVLELNGLIKKNDQRLQFIDKNILIKTNREQIVDWT
jgi:hypothetical protein